MNQAESAQAFSPQLPIGKVGHDHVAFRTHHDGFDRARTAEQHPELTTDLAGEFGESPRQFLADEQIRRHSPTREAGYPLPLGRFETS